MADEIVENKMVDPTKEETSSSDAIAGMPSKPLQMPKQSHSQARHLLIESHHSVGRQLEGLNAIAECQNRGTKCRTCKSRDGSNLSM